MSSIDAEINYSPDFIKKVRYLMNSRRSKKLDDTYAKFTEEERPEFTNLLVDCGINPLEHLDSIPAYYAFGTSIYKELKIPPHIKSIGEYAFLNAGLIRVYTGQNIESIGEGAFAANGSLVELYLDNNGTLKKIGRGAFSNCSKLEGTILWDGIEEIDSQVFEFCTEMRDLRMLPSVKRIGDGAFFGCNKLKVWYYGTIDQFRQIRLDDIHLTHVNCLLKNGGNDWVLYKLY
jgi:hypothetical protein